MRTCKRCYATHQEEAAICAPCQQDLREEARYTEEQELKASLYRRIMLVREHGEVISVFVGCVRDVAGKNGGDYKEALQKVLSAVLE